MDLSNVRIKEHFGIVTNDTSTNQFSFLISPPKNRKHPKRKKQIICLDHPKNGDSCQVIAEVKDITSYEEVAGSTIGERVGRLHAMAQIIGYFDLRNEPRPMKKPLIHPTQEAAYTYPTLNF